MSDHGRRHIPSASFREDQILDFASALSAAELPQADYDVRRWLFVPTVYTEYRYILGTRGARPLICIGINPSTARPDHLDPTLQSVERIALGNGFDSFIMLNLCAQRATDPNDMAQDYPEVLRGGNLDAFRYALGLGPEPTVWAAWGTMIEKRPYLNGLLREMAEAAVPFSAKWVTFGKRSRQGHPHHPLYLSRTAMMEAFDIDNYIRNFSDKEITK